MLREECEAGGLELRLPAMTWAQDNGAMIAALGAQRLARHGGDSLDLAPVATSDDRTVPPPPSP